MNEKIFVTGISGCVGHYVFDELIKRPNTELHLLVRDPDKLKFKNRLTPNIHIHKGGLEDLVLFKPVLREADFIIHIATDWGGSHVLNIDQSRNMLDMADPKKLKKMIYFSTASILGKDNKPIKEAEIYGTGYVKTKYLCYQALQMHPLKEKVVTLFPTLVFGGDDTHPYSHVSGGLLPNLKYLKWIRFLSADAWFHSIHAADIASILAHCLDHATPSDIIMGTPAVSGNDAIQLLCKLFGVRQYGHITLSHKTILNITKMLGFQLSEWDVFCILNPYWVYQVAEPKTFGIPTQFPSLQAILEDIKAHAK